MLVLHRRRAAFLGEKCVSKVPTVHQHSSEQEEMSFISATASVPPPLKSSKNNDQTHKNPLAGHVSQS